jgi:starch phosphorylase
VGADNFFLFGLTAEQVYELKTKGYHPKQYYQSDPELREAVDQVSSGSFSQGDRNLFKPLLDSLLNGDPYLLFADYRSYVEVQEQVGLAYEDHAQWTQMSILNVARMGKFSSDRSIKEYCDEIWKVHPITVKLGKHTIG